MPRGLKKIFDRQIREMVGKGAPFEAIWQSILQPENKAALALWAYQGYTKMSLRAWIEHSKWLKHINKITPAGVEAIQSLGVKHAQNVAVRLTTSLESGTAVSASQYVRYISADTVKQGWNGGAKTAAVIGGAKRKQWVRIAPVKEPRPHSVLEGMIIPVDAMFTLPSGKKCTGPHDWLNVPDGAEWINCFHQIIYLD